MNELSKVVNAQLQQAAENLVRNRLMSDEFLDFVQENTKPLDTLMAYYKCAIMEVETKFKVLNEQFSLEYDRNPIESAQNNNTFCLLISFQVIFVFGSFTFCLDFVLSIDMTSLLF